MSGSSGSAGWKNAKQRRSRSSRRFKSGNPWISCTASYASAFSRIACGVAAVRDEGAQELGETIGAPLRHALGNAVAQRAHDALEQRARRHLVRNLSRNMFFHTLPIAFPGNASTK